MTDKEIVEKLSLKQKIELCSGKNFWETKDMPKYGIPSVWLSDGPSGLRKQSHKSADINVSSPATCYPAPSLLACSWDSSLMDEVGRAMGTEAANNDVSLLLAPGVNIKRNPLCGRNFEYLSEDPYLAGHMASAFISGVQSKGVGCCIKHFAVNGQEYKRFCSDSILDERTLREIYLKPFEIAVIKSDPAAVMCAYNKVNGEHCTTNKHLLTEILRGEWGYSGLTITDWGAVHDRPSAFDAGCDLSMPGGSAFMEAETADAVHGGGLAEKKIDNSCERVLSFVRKYASPKHIETHPDFDEIAKKACENSIVLLKNDGTLPLKGEKVCIIGEYARNMRVQGAGSSHVNAKKTVSFCDVCPSLPFAQGYDEDGISSPQSIEEAVKATSDSDICLLFLGLPPKIESEGYDRTSLSLPKGETDLVNALISLNRRIVVVLFGGSAISLPFEKSVSSVVYAGLCGQAGGQALYDVLWGKVNPSGHLAESWPLCYADCPSSDTYGHKDALYAEGIYSGYRYYEKTQTPVLYPFGHGLSYTSFEYTDAALEGDCVSVFVTNTGKICGAEVVQLYTGCDSLSYRPLKELKGFKKVFLFPGEMAKVTFTLTDDVFSCWDGGWKKIAGDYTIYLGSSSKDIRATLHLKVEGESLSVPEGLSPWYISPKGKPDMKDFSSLICLDYVPACAKKGAYSADSTIDEMAKTSLILRLVRWAIGKTLKKRLKIKGRPEGNQTYKLMIISSADATIPCVIVNSQMKNYVFQGLLEIANGHFFKGIKTMCKKFRTAK